MNATLKKPDRRPPVLRTTRHDKVTSGMMCVVTALGMILTVLMLSQIPDSEEPPQPIPIVPVELPPGEVSDAEATAELQSPEVELPEPAIAEDKQDSAELNELLQTVNELSDPALALLERSLESDGKSDRAAGPKPGPGPPSATIPRDQRWFIKFRDASIGEYARQLDHFGIELGALMPDGQLVMMRDVSKAKPTIRTLRTGKGETRLYMSWRGGKRVKADRSLFAKAGVDAESATILHFYSAELEERLARIEVDYRRIGAQNIRRTYFNVVPDGNGFTFSVTSQSYLR